MPKPIPLEAGSKAPSFSFMEAGEKVSSATLDGPCLLYFYPKDDTPGCTKQACGIRDAWKKFQNAGIRVVGVSKDNDASHRKFAEKYSLPFPLIADTELELAKAFGVYGEKKFMGKTFDGIHRMSFLIAEDGKILKTYPKVKPNEHAETVLEDYTQLTA
ncbi:thioredoxin-dependent thiol peroxidase [Coraliomargarita sinensis]|uniref:thioredoxin-dependent peroxiredoxin n=1 Tax=Coraliomargarita sinensis TaxID=2174842 RepID=A0A317ZL15_9BACT|nr:thioredoxin-dependent thiol peroxidase [Coraliomargarita sinensis]PXA04903.1 thioredoxin-dependent thiol peroxidase [Coraliomargarita sinensis]